MKKNEIRNLAKSFRYAFRGLVYCIKNERNMRIHISAAIVVSCFSWLYGLDETQYLALFLCLGFVIAAEAFNTAVEALVNLESPAYHPYARIAKDVAAGAVLISALTAVAVGGILFLSDPVRLWETICRIIFSPVYGPVFLVLLALSVFFVFNGKPFGSEKNRDGERLSNFDESVR